MVCISISDNVPFKPRNNLPFWVAGSYTVTVGDQAALETADVQQRIPVGEVP
jgi:hypothetical protein